MNHRSLLRSSLLHALMAVAAALASLGLAVSPAQAATVGSGKVAQETRTVGTFQAIAMTGSIDVEVRQGDKEAVEVSADDNLLPLIETVVESGAAGPTLMVRFKRGENLRIKSPVKVRVQVVKLGALSSSGSGDVSVQALKTPALRLSISGASDARLSELATDSLEVRIAGAGDVQASGQARQLKVAIAGSGDVRLEQLQADDVNVSIAGSGDAKVRADKSLGVSIAGSGDVEYSGAVTAVRSSVAGSGRVIRR